MKLPFNRRKLKLTLMFLLALLANNPPTPQAMRAEPEDTLSASHAGCLQ